MMQQPAGAGLDVPTLVKALQAVSREIHLDKLVETLLATAIRSAGATRGVLKICRGGDPLIEAEAVSETEGISFTRGATTRGAPLSILERVARTGERVLLDDTTAPDGLDGDDYIRARRPRSLLCLPIVSQGKTVGVLYLENELTSSAFTPGSLALVEILASQAAISLENAWLYARQASRDAYLAEAQALSKTGSVGLKPATGEIFWSEETFRIGGLDPRTKPTLELILERSHPDDRALVQRALAPIYTGAAETLDLTHRLVLPDGTTKHVHVVGRVVRNPAGERELVGAVRDVTEEKLAQEALLRSESLGKEAQRLSKTGSFFFLPETDEIFWAEELARVFQLDYHGPHRRSLQRDRVHPDDRWITDPSRGQILQGKPLEYEVRLLMPDGRVKYVHVTAHTRKNEERGRLETFGAVQDVTERKRAEDAIAKMHTELSHVARVSALGALAASIAHEVNQPLSAIMVNAAACGHWLEGDPDVAEARSAADRVVRDATRAAGVIVRLRALFNKAEPVSELLSLNEAIEDVLALTRRELQEAHVVVRSDLAASLPAIRGDRVQLQQVVLNLALNAAEAMSAVQDRARELTVSTRLVAEDRVEIVVKDTGKGIDPRSAARLFEPFYTTKAGGMGMGLSISKAIVEDHGGTIRVEPNPDAGVTFRVTIPRSAQAPR